jgi:putative phage-type endonuclease
MGSKPSGISASRGAAILGLSEYQTPFEVWQRIMEAREPGFNAARGYTAPPELDNPAIRWGTAFESAVIKLAEQSREDSVYLREQYFTAAGHKFITCHIDGAYFNHGMYPPQTLHEGKTTSAFAFQGNWGKPGTDHIPEVYQVQVQHQMICTGAQEVIVSVLVFPRVPDEWEEEGWEIITTAADGYALRNMRQHVGSRSIETWAMVLNEMGYFHQYTVPASQTLQQMMVRIYHDFWERYVLTGAPPEPRTYEDIKRLIPAPKGTVVCDGDLRRWFAEYAQINAEIGSGSDLAKRQAALRVDILNAVRDEAKLVEDDESVEAIVFRDGEGHKLGSYYRTKSGGLVFRVNSI